VWLWIEQNIPKASQKVFKGLMEKQKILALPELKYMTVHHYDAFACGDQARIDVPFRKFVAKQYESLKKTEGLQNINNG
jgi:hypothetical protein